ncbi:MAG: 1,4-alpha-glucan branching protein GlgB [Balneolaceae bacterium]|nr:1,4-alpha-glucan branching protein GlgB [Balneolaceae bacterium]
MTYTLNKEEIESISNGSHGDPFSVLGFHNIKQGKSEKLVLRVFRPEAKLVFVKIGNTKPVELQRVSPEGLFEYVFPRRKNPAPYSLSIKPHSGEEFEINDAYAFDRMIADFDLQLWGEGNHKKAYEFMGAHPKEVDGVKGIHFVVSAPSATRVSVVGPFNNWDGRVHRMRKYHDQGLWEIFIPQVTQGDEYKYEIKSPVQDPPLLKADPFAFYAQLRPETASKVFDIEGYNWNDDEWVKSREERQALDKPLSVYEVHAGSWRKKVGGDSEYLSYRELAHELVPYVKDLGYTHIELLPIAEHPYDPSWGYQITGYYAPTSRFGTPHDFMYFVDECHKAGIGVIVDWVPAHFAKDDHGLRRFDGTGLYEHEDARQGEHKDWGTCIFNFGRTEVHNFLISNALYWCDKFHIDGLRVDAVASMLYLDYSREEGEWIPNKYGGRENIEAIDFLRKFNDSVHEHFPGTITFAEESTSWGGVSRPTQTGGLGFDYKWNMGWMNDTLAYIEKDPLYRKYHQGELTFSLIYAFSENFTLPFSHDEVVHMKNSMLAKMPGDDWQKFANLRLLYTYMYAHPGKKLLFMGCEFGQWAEWSESKSLDWHLLNWEQHQGVQKVIRDLNSLAKTEKALYENDFDWRGFEWIDFNDADNSIVSFVRRAKDTGDFLITVLNFTPTVHYEYQVGVPEACEYEIIMNSDSEYYGGSNVGDTVLKAVPGEWQNQKASIKLTVPPLAGVILKPKK